MAQSQEIEWLLREKYSGEKSEAFFADCKRLSLGEPLAYLIGWAPFLDTKMYLDTKPLIPRPETEFWVAEAIKVIKNSATLPLGLVETKPLKILDLCAGSGCIGVAVAKALPECLVDFAELDSKHLFTIEKNIKENNIEQKRTRAIHSNLFSNTPGSYDFIFSNPPYIDETLHRTDRGAREHEPYVALFGGIDGLEIIAQLITDAPAHLQPGGQLWIEHEPEQSEAIAKQAAKHHFTATTHKDQYGVERYSILVLQ